MAGLGNNFQLLEIPGWVCMIINLSNSQSGPIQTGKWFFLGAWVLVIASNTYKKRLCNNCINGQK